MSEKTEKPEEIKPEEVKPTEAKPKEAKPKEAKETEKKKEIGAWQHYEYDYKAGKITLKNRKCPRCNAVMAYHKNPVARWTCGTCAYTEYIKTETKK